MSTVYGVLSGQIFSNMLSFCAVLISVLVGMSAFRIARQQDETNNLSLGLEIAREFASKANDAFRKADERSASKFRSTSQFYAVEIDLIEGFIVPISQALNVLRISCTKHKTNLPICRDILKAQLSPQLLEELTHTGMIGHRLSEDLRSMDANISSGQCAFYERFINAYEKAQQDLQIATSESLSFYKDDLRKRN